MSRKKLAIEVRGSTGVLAVGSAGQALKAFVALFGGKRKPRRLKPHELTDILRNLATLVGNGVPLPKALATLAQEDALARHREVLNAVRRKVETGAHFSAA